LSTLKNNVSKHVRAKCPWKNAILPEVVALLARCTNLYKRTGVERRAVIIVVLNIVWVFTNGQNLAIVCDVCPKP
jgi:hypothetical protein